MTDAQRRLKIGAEYPYGGVKPASAAEAAAQGVLADLCDRRGIKHAFDEPDEDIKRKIVQSLAAVIGEAMQVYVSCETRCPQCGTVHPHIEKLERELRELKAEVAGGVHDSASYPQQVSGTDTSRSAEIEGDM